MLMKISLLVIGFAFPGGIAQLVERLVRNEKVRGSNPLTSSPESFRDCRAGAVGEGGPDKSRHIAASCDSAGHKFRRAKFQRF